MEERKILERSGGVLGVYIVFWPGRPDYYAIASCTYTGDSSQTAAFMDGLGRCSSL